MSSEGLKVTAYKWLCVRVVVRVSDCCVSSVYFQVTAVDKGEVVAVFGLICGTQVLILMLKNTLKTLKSNEYYPGENSIQV